MKRLPFHLITGFLGSGKTTLLNRLVAEISPDVRVGIIQNEFGESLLNSSELKLPEERFALLEVNHGSAFCVCLLSDFQYRLREWVQQVQPDIIFMEASGLSDPIAAGEILHASSSDPHLVLTHVWTVVDALAYFQTELLFRRVSRQIEVADSIIVNKADIAQTDLQELQEHLGKLNPLADQLVTSHCQIDARLNDMMRSSNDSRRAHTAGTSAAGRPDVGSAVIREARSFTHDDLQAFLDVWQTAYRIKGRVRMTDGSALNVQQSMGRLELHPDTSSASISELILLGPDVEQFRVRDLLHRYSRADT